MPLQINPTGLQARPQATDLADNSFDSVECTAHYNLGSRGVAGRVVQENVQFKAGSTVVGDYFACQKFRSLATKCDTQIFRGGKFSLITSAKKKFRS